MRYYNVGWMGRDTAYSLQFGLITLIVCVRFPVFSPSFPFWAAENEFKLPPKSPSRIIGKIVHRKGLFLIFLETKYLDIQKVDNLQHIRNMPMWTGRGGACFSTCDAAMRALSYAIPRGGEVTVIFCAKLQIHSTVEIP